MSFRSLARDLRDSIGSLSRMRSFDVRLHSHHLGKSHGAVHELHDQPEVIHTSFWAALPPQLLRDVIKRVSCASVCRSWRKMCKEIVQCPEFSGKLTFPLSLKQLGKVGKDLFRMDYRYPLSAFQAFAICLCKFDWKPPSE